MPAPASVTNDDWSQANNVVWAALQDESILGNQGPGTSDYARQLAAGWLAPGARIYVERARREALPALPAAWQELRSGRAGEVGYHLFGVDGSMPAGSKTTT